MRLSRRCLYGVTRYVGEKRSSGHKSLYRNFEFSVPIVYDRSRPIESKRGTDRLTAFNPSTLVDGPFPFMDQGRGGGRREEEGGNKILLVSQALRSLFCSASPFCSSVVIRDRYDVDLHSRCALGVSRGFQRFTLIHN